MENELLKNQINEIGDEVIEIEETEVGNDMASRTAMDSDTSVRTEDYRFSIPLVKKSIKVKQRRTALTAALDEDDTDGSRSECGNRIKEFLYDKSKKSAQEAEKTVEQQARIAREKRKLLGLASSGGDACLAATLNQQVIEDIDIILKVANKSKNLKTTFQRALKDAAESIKNATTVLHKRSSSEEVQKLQCENSRLNSELSDLRKEVEDLKANMTLLKEKRSISQIENSSQNIEEPAMDNRFNPQSINIEELSKVIMLQVGTLLNTRLEGLEERLHIEKRLRPPIVADRMRISMTKASEGESSTSIEKQKRQESKKGKKKNKEGFIDKNQDLASLAPNHIEAVGEEAGWTVVARKKRKPKTAKSDKKQNSPKRSRAVRLRPPRTTAVVINLLPGAEEQGLTYAAVLADAKQKISLDSCGISGLHFKKSVTGARILQVPGATSGDKADSLAQKLKEVLPEGLVRISRPVKCAEMRILGLDDSVSMNEVIAAVAQKGACSEEMIKAGEVKRFAYGTGVVWVRCPIDVAKKLGAEGRITVGWVSAKVKLLPPREMRCYRCHHSGHVRAQCTSEVDRSENCYRCEAKGHKASDCSATPKCLICDEANKPCDHRLGSKLCCPPTSKKMNKRRENQVHHLAKNVGTAEGSDITKE